MGYRLVKIMFASGTGNSYRAAVWMKETAEKMGIESELEQIKSNRGLPRADKEPGDMLGMVFPTYGFTAPWHVIWRALRLPAGKGSHAFVVASKGALMSEGTPIPGQEGTAAYLIALILALKGYRVRGVMGLDMPANMINVHSGLDEADSASILHQARGNADSFISRVLNGEKVFRGIPSLLLGLMLIPLSAIYLAFVRFFLAKLFFASKDCTGCGLCAKNCPKNAIKMLGRRTPRPYWKLSCESCMRCMGYCPNRAVESSHLFAVLLWMLIFCPLPSVLLAAIGGLLKMDGSGFLIRTAAFYLFFLGSISAAYVLFTWILRIPLLNTLFSYATFTRFYRRYHEPETCLDDISGREAAHTDKPRTE